MAFQPIVSSGVPYSLNIDNDAVGYTAELTAGSVLQSLGTEPHEWLGKAVFAVADGVTVRITSQQYSTSHAGNDQIWFSGPFVSPPDWAPVNITDDNAANGQISQTVTSDGTGFEFDIIGDRAGSQFKFLVEVDVPDAVPDCDEPGQVTRCYVSTFDAPRIHESRLFQQGKRCLEANFNGAIGVGRKIVSVKWSMQTPYSVVMDTARITADQRSTRVNITAAWTGDAWMRAQVTLDNGEIYTQLFHVVVPPSPWFGDVSPTAGPSELTASAP